MTIPITPAQFDGFRPGRLWSLADIMEKVDTSALWNSLSYLRREQVKLEKLPEKERAGFISEKARKGWKEGCEKALIQLKNLHIGGSRIAMTRLLRDIDNRKFTYDKFDEQFRNFDALFGDELQEAFLFALDTKEVTFFSEPRKGWEKIISCYPRAGDDVEEANKCFALSRYAASVFHSLQVVEFGLIDLGAMLGSKDPIRGWSATANVLKKIRDTDYRLRTPFQQEHSKFLEQILAATESLQTAWRNKISHADGKLALLTRDFSPEVAEEILLATRAFMRRLATEGPNVSKEQPS